MHKLIINKLGSIKQCRLRCSSFMTLTGFQASGKSTVAKAIYYFRTIKDDVIEIAKRQALYRHSISREEDGFGTEYKRGLRKGLEDCLREKFLSTFGSSWGMSNEMRLEYYFTKTCYITISLKNSTNYPAPNYIWITFSNELHKFLQEKEGVFSATPLGVPEEEMALLQAELEQVFDDDCSIVYIPAGRSMITLLSQQISYIYANMADKQKRSLDSCTRDYLERVLRMKPEFSEGLLGLVPYSSGKTALPSKIITQALNLTEKVLRGKYRYSDGEEQIVLSDGKYVKLNFSSSGQQECVWILNLLFYYLLQQKPVLFMIEEPESHLFPESQKYMTELIALVRNCGHSVLLTTHSPYVLGTLNNLLYAGTVQRGHSHKVHDVIPESLWIDYHTFSSWFVQNGTLDDGMDAEIHMIQNERIDEISKVINDDFEKLLALQDTDGGE